MNRKDTSNRKLILKLGLIVCGMFGFGFAMVPLYDVFCEITGINGKTGSAVMAENLVEDPNRTVIVEFDSTLNAELNLAFEPQVYEMEVHPGRMYQTVYTAKNNTGTRMTGQAVPSVSPGQAASHFKKTECFCFTRQEFAVGEAREMPVSFYVDSTLPSDVRRITLSYTFFDVSNIN